MEHFGDQTLLIMEREPARLAEVPGISREKAKAIGEEFRLRVGMRQLMEFFSLHHLPAELAVRCYKLYGESTVGLLYDDPYLLMEDGLEAPFGAVDRFAIELGVSGDDPRRVEAGILFELNYNLAAGHCFLPTGWYGLPWPESPSTICPRYRRRRSTAPCGCFNSPPSISRSLPA